MTNKKVEMVLVVDDQDAHRYTTSHALRAAGFEVIEAATGRDALRSAARHPSAIILDVNLPDMSGFEVCRKIKASPITASIPILHLSATLINTYDRVQGLEGGADAYLTHPVSAAELVASVRALIRAKKAEEQAQNLAQQWQTTFDAIPDGVCLLAGNGVIIRENKAFQALGAPARTALGHVEGQGARELRIGDGWFRLAMSLLPSGEVVCIFTDLTTRKIVESAERMARERLEMTQLAARVMPFEWDVGTNRIKLGALGVPLVLGYEATQEEIEFSAFWEQIHPDDRELAAAAIDRTVDDGGEFFLEFRVIWPDCSVHWISAKGRMSFDAGNQPSRLLGVISEVSDKKRAEEALKASEANFRLLAEAIPQMVWTADADGKVEYANRRGQQYGGLQAGDLLGSNAAARVHPDDAARTIAAFRAATAEGRSYTVEARLRRADGEYRWHLCRGVPVKQGGSDGITRWFCTDTDIDEQKRLQEELERARIAAEAANDAKSAFLANMSHEIRTPLGAILGFAELLRDSRLGSDERLQFIETINRNGRDLAVLIDDILDLSKVEAGRIEIETLSFSLVSLVEEVAASLRVRAEENGVALTVTFEGTIPERVVSDPTRLRQILVNIVGNAVKFTAQGFVKIAVRADDRTDSRVRLMVIVEDSGRGIALEHQEKLFRPFSQADGSTTRKFGGTGLGLVLSQRLARLLGGDVVLRESAPGKGSTFVITADVRLGTEERAEPINARLVEVRRDTPSWLVDVRLADVAVLVAEDAPDNQLLIRRWLGKFGASIEIVTNGEAAVERALAQNFDVVLMDIQMPVMDGYSATQELRRRGYNKPIIALTAHAMSNERERCLSAGCNDHLTKPINPKMLLETIERFVH